MILIVVVLFWVVVGSIVFWVLRYLEAILSRLERIEGMIEDELEARERTDGTDGTEAVK